MSFIALFDRRMPKGNQQEKNTKTKLEGKKSTCRSKDLKHYKKTSYLNIGALIS